jgi:nucleoside-diphosphate-sugar epimerase
LEAPEEGLRVFVTGATGYIGSAVAEVLLRKGHDVLALARTGRSETNLRAKGFDVVRASMNNSLALAQAASTSDAVIHTARSTARDGPIVDEEATVSVLRALEETDKPFIYTSGAWVYGNTGDRTVTEADRPSPPAPVAWRHRVEKRVLDATERGIGSVVIRPGVVYGDGGGILESFRREAERKGSVRVMGTGEQRWPFVHRRDLAVLYEKALRAEGGSIFNGTETPSPPVKEVAHRVASSCGGAPVVHGWSVPHARKTIGGVANVLALDQGYISNRKAKEELGWEPQQAQVLSTILHPATQGATDH